MHLLVILQRYYKMLGPSIKTRVICVCMYIYIYIYIYIHNKKIRLTSHLFSQFT
jgi:hypothetical protein